MPGALKSYRNLKNTSWESENPRSLGEQEFEILKIQKFPTSLDPILTLRNSYVLVPNLAKVSKKDHQTALEVKFSPG